MYSDDLSKQLGYCPSQLDIPYNKNHWNFSSQTVQTPPSLAVVVLLLLPLPSIVVGGVRLGYSVLVSHVVQAGFIIILNDNFRPRFALYCTYSPHSSFHDFFFRFAVVEDY